MMAIRTWTKEETASLREMRGKGCNWEEIGSAVRRSAQSCKEHWRWLHMSEELREKRRLRVNERRRTRAGHGYLPAATTAGYISVSGRPIEDLIAEARQRLNAPRTISQMVFGDPPPGYSALDRKRQAIVEPVYVDRRLAQLLRAPTLADRA